MRDKLNEKVILSLLKRAKIRASSLGFDRYSDDIAQEVLLGFVDGNGEHQSIDFAVIDVIRKMFGDSRRPSGKVKQATIKPLRKVLESDIRYDYKDYENRFHYFLSMLNGQDRAIICLYYLWGLNLNEIGYVFGVDKLKSRYLKSKAERVIFSNLKRGSKNA